MIVYCRRCVMPSTLPGSSLDADGVCDACRSYERRPSVDWESRRTELEAIFTRHRGKNPDNYDCIVPVSGGKDSTFQVLKVLEFGLNPLCVTASTDMLTEIGRLNIENLKNLGVDYVEVSVNPRVRRVINRVGLLERGDNIIAEHATIFTVPVRLAVQMDIPLIVWGENSQDEQGGDPSLAGGIMTKRYLKNAIHGFNPYDFLKYDGVFGRDLVQYTYPSDEELDRVGVTGVFLGYYIPWDGRTNALVSQANGLTTYPTAIEGSVVNYENLDNAYTGIHDYLMFRKYAFGRASLIASLHIRRGLYSRKAALALVREREGKFPWTYLGVPVEAVLDDLGVSLEEFEEVCDRFTDWSLFADNDGVAVWDRNGVLMKTNYDNPVEDGGRG